MNKRFKLYLLSILYGFYNDGNVRMAVTEDEVVESWKRDVYKRQLKCRNCFFVYSIIDSNLKNCLNWINRN